VKFLVINELYTRVVVLILEKDGSRIIVDVSWISEPSVICSRALYQRDKSNSAPLLELICKLLLYF
jgi:hypothetical protein